METLRPSHRAIALSLVASWTILACSSSDNAGGGCPEAGVADSSTVPTTDAGSDAAAPPADASNALDGAADVTTAADGAADAADARGDSSSDSSASLPIAVAAPYVASIWAEGTTAYFNPDSIDSDGSHVWVGFQNKTTKDGSDGGPGFGTTSTIAEYSLDGKTVLGTVSVAGHVDGLRIDPATQNPWATSNEDGAPHLFEIDHATLAATEYTLPLPLPHGGGLDDLGFAGGKMFIAASNPSKNPNTDPALYVVTTSGTTATFASAFAGNAGASDYATDAGVTLNLQDPDSITVNAGQLVMASQGDSQLLFVSSPGAGATQQIAVLNVANQLDDTVWVTKSAGQLLVVDGKANTIYSVRRAGGFTVGDVFTETPDDSTIPNILGTLSLATGSVKPIAVGFGKATGLLFVPD